MGKYDDILYLEHPVSKNHKPMLIYDRSAQFAPFAALVGYDESIKEAGETYDEKITISDDKIEEINQVISYISTRLNENPTIKINYFKKLKANKIGRYVELTGQINKIDYQSQLIYINKELIKMTDIIDIELI